MTIPRGRRNYNPISSTEEEQQQERDSTTTDQEQNVASRSSRGRSNFRRVDQGDEEEGRALGDSNDDSNDNNNNAEEESGDRITVIVLDPAQTRFRIEARKSWTIGEFKKQGEKVHKVSPPTQRLIYRGRLLEDSTTLEEAGIVDDDVIIHLFPKPRVVVSSADANEDEECQSQGGAHVPRIVLDPNEAEQRASILVLGSAEVMEAQNNVKLFSFLLLIFSSMELMQLLTILLGGSPTDGSDGTPSGNSGNDTNYPPDDDPMMPPQDLGQWKPSYYFDLVISAVGVYVALLGIKATTDNTLRLAKRYMYGTVLVGIAWNIFYYFSSVQLEREADEERSETQGGSFPPMTNSQIYVQALFSMLLPAMIWVMCCLRAWQFHGLLEEAEREAEERIRSELNLEVEDGNSGGNSNEGNTSSPPAIPPIT